MTYVHAHVIVMLRAARALSSGLHGLRALARSFLNWRSFLHKDMATVGLRFDVSDRPHGYHVVWEIRSHKLTYVCLVSLFPFLTDKWDNNSL